LGPVVCGVPKREDSGVLGVALSLQIGHEKVVGHRSPSAIARTKEKESETFDVMSDREAGREVGGSEEERAPISEFS